MYKILIFLAFFTVVSSFPKNDTNCILNDFSKLNQIINSCSHIVIDNLKVPGGKTLKLSLRKGTSVTFRGTTVFEVAHWNGPLIEFEGEKLVVVGEAGSILNAQGEKYWDGHGGSGGVTKPRFFQISTTGGSIFKNIHLKNCAMFCLGVHATDLTISGWSIDNTAGRKLGRNTDGFGVAYGKNILIEDSTVINQDDCVVVNSGSDMVFKNIHCTGSHGLSFSVGSNTDNSRDYGTIRNISFLNSHLADGVIGIHIKTKEGNGELKDITYENIELSKISRQGIYINQDYVNSGNTNGLFKITNLNIRNVHGTVEKDAIPVMITCNHNKCSNWNWSNIHVTGGKKNSCNFHPTGFSC